MEQRGREERAETLPARTVRATRAASRPVQVACPDPHPDLPSPTMYQQELEDVIMSFVLGPTVSPIRGHDPLVLAAWYRRQQQECPVLRSQTPDGKWVWQVFRYADVVRVLTDDRTFSARMYVERFPREITLNSDNPDHQKYRRIVHSFFTPKAVAHWRLRIEQLVDAFLERGVHRLSDQEGDIDMVEAVAYPLPVRIIAALLGLPQEDEEQLRAWSYELASLMGQPDAAFAQYVSEQVEERARTTLEGEADDLMGTLLRAEQAGELTRGQVVFLVMGLVAAGNITTTMLLSLAVRRFVEQPEIYQHLRQQPAPALLASTLEELLRVDFCRTPTMRVARQDTVLSGQEIRAGEAVIAWVSAANFDEAAFPNALQFQPDRFLPERKASRHLAFGTGTRTCLGTHLAKLEGLVFLERLLHRFACIKAHPQRPPLYPDERFDLMLSYPVRVFFGEYPRAA